MILTRPIANPRHGVGCGWALRSPRAGDAEAWHALQRVIYDEGIAFVGDGAPSTGALAAKLRTRSPAAVHVAFAVTPDGAMIGWLEAQRMTPKRLSHVAWLTVAVAAGWRRRGVGSALLAEARAWGRAQRVHKLQLHVRAGNRAAIALYGRLGYEVEGVLRDQIAATAHGAAVVGAPGPTAPGLAGHPYEDEWVMALSLADGRA